MSRAPIAQFKNVSLTLGGAPLFSGVDFALSKGDRACLIGANGAGKSTLMRILAGALEQDAGEVFRQPGARMAYVSQEPSFAGFANLLDFAAKGLDDHGHRMAEAELIEFGLDPARSCEGLSGGESRRAALARVFASEADIVLLDEPTNHLDIAAIELLEIRLAAYRGAALIVSHDRRFLERVSSACLWLRNGKVQRLDRGFTAFEEWAEATEKAESEALSRLETQLRAEEHWLQRGVTARRARNEGRRRKLMSMRAERREQKGLQRGDGPSFTMQSGESSGKLVIEAKKISKSWPAAEGEPPKGVIDTFDILISRGDRIGVIGPNGAGKSTLLKTLLGEIAPDTGSVRRGANVTSAHLDQTRDALDPKATIWDTLAPLGGDQVMVRGHPRHVAAYAADFLFSQKQLRQPVSALSGGERNRLLLAVAMTKPANLLVLDEPTNDLDMETLDLLEDTLASYDGTLILVSHDRAFLDNVVTSILAPLGSGRWAETPGGWSDYERERATRAEQDTRAAKSVAGTSAANASKREQKKLSYKDERRLAELNDILPSTQKAIAGLEARLGDPNLYAKSPAEAAKLGQDLDAKRNHLEELELEWLELEGKREALT